MQARAPSENGARLLFVGDGPLKPWLERRATELKLPVSFAGYVADATRYLRAFDLLLFPASEVEAFGMVALEAMLAEVPVVASSAPGPRLGAGRGGRLLQEQRCR